MRPKYNPNHESDDEYNEKLTATGEIVYIYLSLTLNHSRINKYRSTTEFVIKISTNRNIPKFDFEQQLRK